MRPLLVNCYDSNGGAAIAAMRLNEALRQAGSDSRLLAQIARQKDVLGPRGIAGEIAIRLRQRLEKAPLLRYPQAPPDFSPHVTPSATARRIRRWAPDLVHLHWVSHGMLRIEDFVKLRAPLIWTMHDMWTFTGGCHYSGSCRRYEAQCGRCPQLASQDDQDLSFQIWQRKRIVWKDLGIQLVAPSRWLAASARASSLFAGADVAVIPNTLDTQVFRPQDQAGARQRCGLPQGQKLVLFGAIESLASNRKGAHLLMPTLERLRQAFGDEVGLVVIGASGPRPGMNFPLPVHYAGHLSKEADLAAYYSAADVVVLPSVEDNLPNVALEALACGRPCVAFDIGGLPDLILHSETGYLARPFDVEDLAAGIGFCLDDGRAPQLRSAARRRVEQVFAPAVVAAQHLDLYRRVLARAASASAAALSP